VRLLQCQAACHGQLALVRDANLATGEEERDREGEGKGEGGELERREIYLKMNPIKKEVVNYHFLLFLPTYLALNLQAFKPQNS